MRRRLCVLLAALPVALIALVHGNAQAGGGGDTLTVFTEDLNDSSVPRFAFEVDGDPCLSDTVLAVPGAPTVDLDLADANGGTFTLPGAPPGEYDVEVTCTTDSGTETGSGFIDFGYVVVDKVVTGDVPPSATFAIDVSCDAGIFQAPSGAAYGGESGEGFGPDAIQATLDFGPGGGSETLVHYRSQTCTIEETDTGGALVVTVETEDCGELIDLAGEGTSGAFEVNAPVSCQQTVTNEFAPADVEPDDDEPDTLPDVVVATPTFTG